MLPKTCKFLQSGEISPNLVTLLPNPNLSIICIFNVCRMCKFVGRIQVALNGLLNNVILTVDQIT